MRTTRDQTGLTVSGKYMVEFHSATWRFQFPPIVRHARYRGKNERRRVSDLYFIIGAEIHGRFITEKFNDIVRFEFHVAEERAISSLFPPLSLL